MTTAKQESVRPTTKFHRGYIAHLLKFCKEHHLLGHAVALQQVLVQPRFITPLPFIAPVDENLTQSVFNSVPIVMDYPHLHAHYHVLTYSIEELGKGDTALVLVGNPNSGKTTALLAIALWSLGQVDFPTPPDVIQQRIDAEESALSADERAERIKERLLIAQQALQRFTEKTGRDYRDDDTAEERARKLPALRRVTPIYIHLGNVLPTHPEYGRTADPAEPLVRGVQHQVGGIASKTLPASLYKLLQEGKALVLIDGFDDVPQSDQAEKLAWLKGFMAHYSHNRIIVTATPSGYQNFVQMGFSAVQLRPWDAQDTLTFSHKVLDAWGKISSKPSPTPDTLLPFYQKARFLNPLETTLRLLSDGQVNETEQIKQYLQRVLPQYTTQEPDLQQLARLQFEHGWITRQQLIDLALTTSHTPIADTDTKQTDTVQEKRLRQIVREKSKLLSGLVAQGVLSRYRGDRYRFRYVPIAGALLASHIQSDELINQHQNPDWQGILPYIAQHHAVDVWVTEILNQSQDVLLSGILSLTKWLRFVTPNVAWRTPLLKVLANWMVAPNQYQVIRERIAAALISSGDEGVLMVFRRMVQHQNPDIRRVGCFALGALKDADAIRPLSDMMLGDPENAVQVASALALGAIGTEASLAVLEKALYQAISADVKRACAETFSHFPDIGYPILFDSIQSPESTVRRATVWGLGRLRTGWSLVMLNEVYITDVEWYVQTAAVQVFMDVYEDGKNGVHQYPIVNDIEWLQNWARKGIKSGVVPMTLHDTPLLLFTASQKNDLMERLMACVAIGQLGLLEGTEVLYKALYDPQEAIRDAAYRSLCEIALGWNALIPGCS